MNNPIVLNCSDGRVEVDHEIYDESFLVRDFIKSQSKWITSHTMEEVNSEIIELSLK